MPSADRIPSIAERLDRLDHAVSSIATQNLHSPLSNEGVDLQSQALRPPLPVQHTPQDSASSVHHPFPGAPGVDAGADVLTEEDDSRYIEPDGLSSLAAHSTFAVDFLTKVANWDERGDLSGSTRGLLSALNEAVGAVRQPHTGSHSRGSPNERSRPAASRKTTSSQHKSMPPLEVSVAIIQQARAVNSLYFGFFRKLSPLASLSDLCLSIYFEPVYDRADYIIVNCILYNLLEEARTFSPAQGESLQAYQEYRGWFAANLEKALNNLPLLMPRTHRMVLALAISVSQYLVPDLWQNASTDSQDDAQSMYAMGNSKTALSQTLVASAYQAACVLGYHKIGSDVPDHTGLLFWVIYFLEKALSLRLGRASTIPDDDITVPYPGGADTSCPIMLYCQLQVKLARLAGRVYLELFSARSLELDADTQRSRVQTLAHDVTMIQQAYALNAPKLRSLASAQDRLPLYEFTTASDAVIFFSLLTLVHRASPLPKGLRQPFNDECLRCARAALSRHNQSDMSTPPLLDFYMNWTLLFFPFIPFFVLFCHVINTGEREDFTLLGTFVTSIGGASQHPALEGLHRLFQAFYVAAQNYLERKNEPTVQRAEDKELEAQLDSYLGTLGLRPLADLTDDHSWYYPNDGDLLAQNQGFSTEDLYMSGQDADPSLQSLSFQPPNLEWFGMNQPIFSTMRPNPQ
ncbi:hypothetical protein AYO20_11455 [Fonsecaea nubica]|uniref:Xylanolytic transcriptional activator regulatory domain-containing protein n=1 Tax=Fonsecaea nubica TaxID=856822 RepID=A0A178BTJ9_9EURO|nr:hypothetical protein AYO20_11455 [Fonsecaea nubica]OAL20928.1 hypothetical protein AYO20_11455 [Fonsecaea nubica]